MPDTKLSALVELATTPASDDEVYIRDVSEPAADESKRITIANLMAAAGGATLTVAETEVFNATSPTSWTDLDLSGTIGANASLVILKVTSTSGTIIPVSFRKNGDTDEFYHATPIHCATSDISANIHNVYICATDNTGKIEWKCSVARADTTVDIIAYIK